MYACVCVCVRVFVSALTGEVGLEASFLHELGHDVDRLSSGAHGQQLDQLGVMEALQCLNLLDELVLLRVLWRSRNITINHLLIVQLVSCHSFGFTFSVFYMNVDFMLAGTYEKILVKIYLKC